MELLESIVVALREELQRVPPIQRKVISTYASLMVGVYALGYFQCKLVWIVLLIFVYVISDERWRKEQDELHRRERMANEALKSSEKADTKSKKDVNRKSTDSLLSGACDDAEWLNEVVKRLWPSISDYLANLIMASSYESQLRHNLMSRIPRLEHFAIEHISMGTVPFQVVGVKIHDDGDAATRSIHSGIVADIDFRYEGDCDIRVLCSVLKIAKLQGKIQNFKINGELRVVLKPTVSYLPIAGGIEFYFVKQPKYSFELGGKARRISQFKDHLNSFIYDRITASIVFPNKLCIPRSSVSHGGQSSNNRLSASQLSVSSTSWQASGSED